MNPTWDILQGDCIEVMRAMEPESVHCCVTSPPYWGLRSYGVDGAYGLEPTLGEYIERMVEVFREVWRVLRADGQLWLNLGDAYAGGQPGSGGAGDKSPIQRKHVGSYHWSGSPRVNWVGLKPKDLIGLPWRVAFALQADGWWLRSDIIWCLSGGAWLYAKTQKGEMPVMLKDLVRLDPSTAQLWNGEHWTQVLAWSESPNPGEKLELVLRSGERIGCTGTHRWPTQRGVVAANELQVGDVIPMATLPEPEPPFAPPYMTPDLLWLIGLYLAEGSRADDTVQIGLNADELGWLPRIEAAAAQVGATVTHTISGQSLNVRLYGRVLVAVIEEYIKGRTAHDKHLSATTWRLPNDALCHVISGYLDGDGSYQGNRIRLGFTRNYSLERDLRTAAARLGATITLNLSTSTYQRGTRPSFHGEWRWEQSGHWNEKDRGEIVEIRRSRARRFYDVSVADDPHLFALASGVLTHNSKPNPMPESVTDRPTRAHEYVFLLSKSGSPTYWTHRELQGTRSRPNPDYRWVDQATGIEHETEPADWSDELIDCPDCGGNGEIVFTTGQASMFDGPPTLVKICSRCNADDTETPGQIPRWKHVNLWRAHDYYYDADAIRETNTVNTIARLQYKKPITPRRAHPDESGNLAELNGANKRTVWSIATQPYKGSHFATFPEAACPSHASWRAPVGARRLRCDGRPVGAGY